MPEERALDPVDQLEMRVAIAASEDRGRREVADAVKAVRDDLRRDIKLYVGLGVMAGNGIAAFVIARLGPGSSLPSAAHAIRTLLPL